MKYICFGYLDADAWNKAPPQDQLALIDRCCDYDETLKRDGHWVSGEGLKGPESTVTLQFQKGTVSVTDGPYAETKEILGGLLIIDARDLNDAVRLISNHPGVQMGRWEIRPAEDLTPMIEESKIRRAAAPQGAKK
jgi:hypothetical protein